MATSKHAKNIIHTFNQPVLKDKVIAKKSGWLNRLKHAPKLAKNINSSTIISSDVPKLKK